MEGKFIVASGPVIIENGKLLVSKDDKDDFYKLPGGTVEENETLEECAVRELKQETGFSCDLIKKLSTMKLTKKSGTKEEIRIKLHHYSAKLKSKIKNHNSFYYNGHEVVWIPIEKIKLKKYEVAPNIYFLINKKEIKP